MTENLENQNIDDSQNSNNDENSNNDDANNNDLKQNDNIQENDDAQNNQNDGNSEIYGSPEKFDYSSVKLPDGMNLDEELIKEFEPIAKKFNLSNKSATELMELAVKLTEKSTSKFSDYAKAMQEAKVNSYIEKLNTDKELNVSDSAKYDAYLDVANQGIKAFATPDFIEFLKTEGLMYHPEFIKTFHKIGKMCISDKLPDVKMPSEKKLDTADILYKD